jgi:hypothetical protein
MGSHLSSPKINHKWKNQEIRELGFACKSGRMHARTNTDKRNTQGTTRTSVPHAVSNVSGAAKRSSIPFGCSLQGELHNGFSVECIVCRCFWMVIKAHSGACHLETGSITPTSGSKRNLMLRTSCKTQKQPWRSLNGCKRRFGCSLRKKIDVVLAKQSQYPKNRMPQPINAQSTLYQPSRCL